MKKILLVFALALALWLPGSVALAQGSEANNCTFDSNSNSICNPIESDNLEDLLINITRYILQIIAVISVVMIVIAGFRMVISAGNPDQVKAAKATLTWAILGLVLALLAYTIVAIVQGVIKGQ